MLHPCDHAVGRLGHAITPECGQSVAMAFARVGCTAIRDTNHVKTAISPIPNGVIAALIGQKTGHDNRIDADIAHQIFKICRIEQ